MKKLAIVSTHPIQYYAPVFQLLAERFELMVFYTGGEQLFNQYDHGFKQKIVWDIDLLSGYPYTFLENKSEEPGSHHFNGIKNVDIIAQLKAFSPDGILVYGWKYHSHLMVLRYFKRKIPLYFRGDSTLLDPIGVIKGWLRKLSLRWVYSHITAAFYVGQANKKYFKAYGLRENQLVFSPHAIDNKRFATTHTVAIEKLRNELNIGQEEILILFAGKFEVKKDPTILLTAFNELKLPNVHLLFVGNGALENQLKQSASKNPRVSFLDFQNQQQMPIIYQACDLYCLPSKGPGETWGLAVNEAMAAKKAVLVSDKVGCSLDLIKPKTGAIFKSENIEDLKQKLIALTQQKTVLKEMGQHAYSLIQKYSFEEQVDAVANYVNR